MHPIKHFITITKHRHQVMLLCFRIGLYGQGLRHDLSKYTLTEFWRGAKYYQGDRSPNNREREVNGFSVSWLHHKGRNRHHFEYWLDYDEDRPGHMKGMRMPRRFVAEMFCDRIAACKTYQRDGYTKESPARFYYRALGKFFMHPQVRRELSFLLTMLAEKDERETLDYVKKHFLKGDPVPESWVEYEDLRAFDRAFGIDTDTRRDGPEEEYMRREAEAMRRMGVPREAGAEAEIPADAVLRNDETRLG